MSKQTNSGPASPLPAATPPQGQAQPQAGTPPNQGQNVQAAGTQGQTPPKTPEDEMRALLQDLAQASNGLSGRDAMLQFTVARLNMTADGNPAAMGQESFRREVAYAVQDMERATGRQFAANGALGTEMRQLASTLPGLDNGPLRDLLSATASIRDQGFVRDIRSVAQAMAAAGEAQTAPTFTSVVAALKDRYRHQATPQVVGASPVASTAAAAPEAASAPRQQADAQPGAQTGAQQPQNTPRGTGAAQAAATTGQGQQSAVLDIMRRMRAPVPTGAETVYPPPTASIAGRIAAFEAKIAEGKTQGLIENAERTGVDAMRAMEQFVQGSGRGILGKIEAAASTEPGGMQTVMTEMQPGGRYANLRTEFDNAYQQDQVFRGAYDNMMNSTANFGKAREAVSGNFAQRNLDPNQLAGRFERAEEALGENLSKMPGKQPGQSALDELSEKLGEILRTAIDRVKQIFRPGAAAQENQQARPGRA